MHKEYLVHGEWASRWALVLEAVPLKPLNPIQQLTPIHKYIYIS